MVEAGAFSVNGLVPGRYNMFAHLENGRTVMLPDPVDVAIEMNTAPLQMELPGQSSATTSQISVVRASPMRRFTSRTRRPTMTRSPSARMRLDSSLTAP